MKYTINNHVRMILLWAGYLGFNTYQEAESAILSHENWFEIWDTSEWSVEDVTYVSAWREEQITKHLIPIQ